MFLDSNQNNVYVTGYYATANDPDNHAAMILGFNLNGQLILRSEIQLSGRKTEGQAISVNDNKIFLAARSDYRQCGLASGTCSGDWVITADMSGQILAQFPVGNTKDVRVSDRTDLTDMLVLKDFIWVTGNRIDKNNNILGSFLQRFSKDIAHSILFHDIELNRYDCRMVPESESDDNKLLLGSTVFIDRSSTSVLSIEKRDQGNLFKPFQFSSRR
jgi:hypothetical protein